MRIEEIAARWETHPRPVSNRPQVTGRNAADLEDSRTRAAWGSEGKRPWGRGLRAAFYAELPPTPLGLVTQDQARLYLDAVIRVREMGGWSTRENEKLRMIQRRWERRVRGEDRRFNALGGVFSGIRQVPADRLAGLRKEMGI